jgi:hypothetical protein
MLYMFLRIETILRYNEFGADGGPAAKEFATKFSVLQKNLSSVLGVRVPDVDVRAFWSFYSLDQLFTN